MSMLAVSMFDVITTIIELSTHKEIGSSSDELVSTSPETRCALPDTVPIIMTLVFLHLCCLGDLFRYTRLHRTMNWSSFNIIPFHSPNAGDNDVAVQYNSAILLLCIYTI